MTFPGNAGMIPPGFHLTPGGNMITTWLTIFGCLAGAVTLFTGMLMLDYRHNPRKWH